MPAEHLMLLKPTPHLSPLRTAVAGADLRCRREGVLRKPPTDHDHCSGRDFWPAN
jgi:hypothetical protein